MPRQLNTELWPRERIQDYKHRHPGYCQCYWHASELGPTDRVQDFEKGVASAETRITLASEFIGPCKIWTLGNISARGIWNWYDPARSRAIGKSLKRYAYARQHGVEALNPRHDQSREGDSYLAITAYVTGICTEPLCCNHEHATLFRGSTKSYLKTL